MSHENCGSRFLCCWTQVQGSGTGLGLKLLLHLFSGSCLAEAGASSWPSISSLIYPHQTLPNGMENRLLTGRFGSCSCHEALTSQQLPKPNSLIVKLSKGHRGCYQRERSLEGRHRSQLRLTRAAAAATPDVHSSSLQASLMHCNPDLN